MKTFVEFFKDHYMLYENIIYLEQHCIKPLLLQNMQFDDDYDDNEDIQQKQQTKLQKFLKTIDKTKAEEDLAGINNDDPQNVKFNLQNVQLVKKFQANPQSKEGQQAVEQLIKRFTKYIYTIIWKFQTTGIIPPNHADDSFQDGVYGLMKGLEKINVDQNSSNARTYNVKWSDKPIKTVPVLSYVKEYIEAAIRKEFSPDRKQSITGYNVGVKDRQGNYEKYELLNVDKPAGGARGQWADKDATIGDIIPDPNSFTVSPIDAADRKELNDKFNEYLKRLPEKELTALKLFMIDNKTYQEIGNILGMSKQAAQYFIDKALAKVRQFAKEDGFEPDQKIKNLKLRGILSDAN